jgi:hypothetical protein
MPNWMNSEVVLELHFLPCLEYFTLIMQYDTVRLEAQEFFPRQTYRNRYYVLTANKVDVLTIPVQTARRKTPIRDVMIDYSQPWFRRHWGCLQSAYGKSPFFEYYSEELAAVFHKQVPLLFDLSAELLTLCLKWLGIKKDIEYTLSYLPSVNSTQFDARSMISAKNSINNHIFYKNTPYYQTFGNDFVPNLSIIDLLFNKGPESRQILKESMVSPLLIR